MWTEELGTEPAWKPVGDNIEGPLESQYQRFLESRANDRP
jgi:hypothetical protein